MFEDPEDTSDVDEDFFSALALLHSTEDDSAEKLRKMVDSLIERRCGYEKTLMARMPKKFLQSTKICGKTTTNEKPETVTRKKENMMKKSGSYTVFASDVSDGNWQELKTFNVDVEDYSEKGDIPRISIPDEGSSDGLLCKVCNVAKLGPLILLECQECQEGYHPLCHQPPVVDIDIYDPRIVWRCKKCTDSSQENSTQVALDEKKVRKSCPSNDSSKVKDASATKMDKLGKFSRNHVKNETNAPDQSFNDEGGMFAPISEDSLIPKNSLRLTRRIMKAASSNQLRKRIGSKLSVTRCVAK